MRKAIIVVSAPRSGSSCLTGCFALCGASVGRSQSKKCDRYNERGYFENMALMKFNSDVLQRGGASIFEPRRVYPDDRVAGGLKRLINDEFAGEDTIVIKDPRMLLLWSAYTRALDGWDLRFVIHSRGKRANVESLRRFGPSKQLSDTQYEVIWCYYKTLSELFVIENPSALFVNFEYIETQIEAVCRRLGLEYNAEVERFINPELRHWA